MFLLGGGYSVRGQDHPQWTSESDRAINVLSNSGKIQCLQFGLFSPGATSALSTLDVKPNA